MLHPELEGHLAPEISLTAFSDSTAEFTLFPFVGTSRDVRQN
jgi:hypothetical protein